MTFTSIFLKQQQTIGEESWHTVNGEDLKEPSKCIVQLSFHQEITTSALR